MVIKERIPYHSEDYAQFSRPQQSTYIYRTIYTSPLERYYYIPFCNEETFDTYLIFILQYFSNSKGCHGIKTHPEKSGKNNEYSNSIDFLKFGIEVTIHL